MCTNMSSVPCKHGLAARGESVASHRDGRGASRARRDDREFREYLREEQRRPRGCIARRMQPDFHHGLLSYTRAVPSSSIQALLARAGSALERGHGKEAAQLLAPVLRSPALTRDDELAVRSMLAEGWLLEDDLDQAAAVLGRPPDALRESVPPGRLSTLWRLHGRLPPA